MKKIKVCLISVLLAVLVISTLTYFDSGNTLVKATTNSPVLDPNAGSYKSAAAGNPSAITIYTNNAYDVIYAVIYAKDSAKTFSTPISNPTLTWTSRGSSAVSNYGRIQCWYAVAANAYPSTGIAVTFSTSGGSNGVYYTVFAVSGCVTTSASTIFDSSTAVTNYYSGTGTGTSGSSSLSITTSKANDLIVGMVGLPSYHSSITAGSAFSYAGSNGQSVSGCDEKEAPSSAGTYYAGFTWSTSSNWLGAMDSFSGASPSVALTPSGGPINTAVVVSGDRFASGAALSATFDGSAVILTPSGVHADGSGNVPSSVTFLVPSAATAGDKSVVIKDAFQNSATATFKVNPTIAASVSGSGGGISPTGTVTVNYGSDQTFNFSPDPNYHVASVTVDGSSLSSPLPSSYTFHTVTTSTHTISVSFAIDTNTIAASAGAGGSISPIGTVTVNYGADQAFTITASAHYHVASVLVDGTSQGIITTYTFHSVTDSTHTISATFAIDQFTLSLIVSGTGSGKVNDGSSDHLGTYTQTYDYGTSVTLAPTADVSSSFTGWSGLDGSDSGPLSLTMNTARSVIATFTLKTFTLTVTQSDHGTISPETTTVNYDDSQDFTITPADGYYIDSITTDAGGVTVTAPAGQTITFSDVQASHTITASFALSIHTTALTISVSPSAINKYDGVYATVSGYLKSEGTGLNNYDIAISYNDGRSGHWVECGTATTGSDGYYTLNFPITKDFANGFVAFQAEFAGDSGNGYAAAKPATTGTVGEEPGNLNVLPEYLFGGLAAIGACFVALAVFKKRSNLTHLNIHF